MINTERSLLTMSILLASTTQAYAQQDAISNQFDYDSNGSSSADLQSLYAQTQISGRQFYGKNVDYIGDYPVYTNFLTTNPTSAQGVYTQRVNLTQAKNQPQIQPQSQQVVDLRTNKSENRSAVVQTATSAPVLVAASQPNPEQIMATNTVVDLRNQAQQAVVADSTAISDTHTLGAAASGVTSTTTAQTHVSQDAIIIAPKQTHAAVANEDVVIDVTNIDNVDDVQLYAQARTAPVAIEQLNAPILTTTVNNTTYNYSHNHTAKDSGSGRTDAVTSDAIISDAVASDSVASDAVNTVVAEDVMPVAIEKPVYDETTPAVQPSEAVVASNEPQAVDRTTIEPTQPQGVDNNVGVNVDNGQAQPVAPQVAAQTKPVSPSSPVVAEQTTPSMVVDKKPQSADEALATQEGDATSEKNLEEVFTANEKRYSLVKKGNWGVTYDVSYSYYRDTRLDLATASGASTITRLRIEEDAQHTVVNSFDMQYGLQDNLTLSASVPIVAKSDLAKDSSTVGLGDVSLGARWEPFPLERDKLPLIFNASVSLPVGKSPYEVNSVTGMSTGKGYYSFSGGVSTRKYIDPVVLFGSASVNYGIERTGLNQQRGNTTLTGMKPNLGFGFAIGFAYSLNYDVSLTMSYQQSFQVGSEFTFRDNQLNKDGQRVERVVTSADQSSAALNFAMGVRVSPETIVNTSVGIGLTEDAPDVTVGLSFPLDFLGFGKKN